MRIRRLVTAAVGGLVMRSSTATPAVAVRAAASAPTESDTKGAVSGLVIDSTT